MTSYLITTPDGSKLLWKGDTENDAGLVWLCRGAKRLWSVPQHAIRKLDPVEALVLEGEGVRGV